MQKYKKKLRAFYSVKTKASPTTNFQESNNIDLLKEEEQTSRMLLPWKRFLFFFLPVLLYLRRQTRWESVKRRLEQ